MFLALVLHYIIHFFATEGVKHTDDDKNLKDKKSPETGRNKVNDADSDSSEEMKLSKAKIVSPFAGYGITRTKIVDIASSSESFASSEDDAKTESKKTLKKKAPKKRYVQKRTVRKWHMKSGKLEKEEEQCADSEKFPIIFFETIEHEEIGKGMKVKVPVAVLKASTVMKKGKNSARHTNYMKDTFAAEHKKANNPFIKKIPEIDMKKKRKSREELKH